MTLSIPLPYVFAALGAFLVYRWRYSNLSHIPTIGGTSLPLLSYIGALRVVRHGKEMLEEGYQKYKGGVFKVPAIDRWIVVVSGPELIDELRKMPDEMVSFELATGGPAMLKYTFGEGETLNVDLIRNKLTRALNALLPEIQDEIVAAFNDFIPATDDWTSVHVMPIMQNIVARVSSRVFVGLPLCRNKDYLNLAIFHTMAVVKVRKLLNIVPTVLKPFAASFLPESRQGIKMGEKFLGSMVRDRLEKISELGNDWSDKPNDLLQWTLEDAVSKGESPAAIVRSIMITNFAAIHTSSSSFTQALYMLAAHPECIPPLREEVETIIEEEGWTKAALGRLQKLDSFMRENQRVNGITNLSVLRVALQDFTLSDGTFIPAGTFVSAPARCTHMDEGNYDDATVFNPWRFSEMREGDGEGTKHHFVSTSSEYIVFGHGKHACPGRFFAVNELKAMMAHLVLNYDVKFEDGQACPENLWFAMSILPDPSIKVLFRKRRN